MRPRSARAKRRGTGPLRFLSMLVFLSLILTIGWGASPQEIQDQEAARVGDETCLLCHNQHRLLPAIPHAQAACEDCHGPASLHFEAGGQRADSLDFERQEPRWVNTQCLACHNSDPALLDLTRSAHFKSGLSCVSCHQMHPQQGSDAESLSFQGLLLASHNQVCFTCHQDSRADFRKPYRHPVLEGGFKCVDCHLAHGEDLPGQRGLQVGTEEGCVECHSEKKGPFVFEHAPLELDNCQSCHQPHGSINPKMLARAEVQQLCLECHSLTAGLAASQPRSFHDLRTARFRNCTTCHTEIHGSNVSPQFLR